MNKKNFLVLVLFHCCILTQSQTIVHKMKINTVNNGVMEMDVDSINSIEFYDEEVIQDPGLALPYESTNIRTDWTTNPVTDDDPWIPGYSYLQATGYQKWDGQTTKSNKEVEGYYISPGFCTKVSGNSVVLGFNYTLRYSSGIIDWDQYHKIYVSKNYDGNVEHFSDATWTAIDWVPEQSPYTDWTLYPSGDIELPKEFVGQNNIHIALWFYAPQSYSTTWELKNFYINEVTDTPQDTTTTSWEETCKQKIETPALSDSENVYFIQHSTQIANDSVMTYCLEYDVTKNHSRWIAFRFDAQTRGINSTRGTTWYDDPKLPSQYWQGTGTYKGGVRGHLCASHDRRYTQECNDQTFYMTNMSPMNSDFNSYYWTTFESHVQSLGRNTTFSDTLYVVKGGTIDETIGTATSSAGKLMVIPKYYYIALLKVKNGKYSAMAFWVEHNESSSKATTSELQASVISIDQLEENTGIDFFHNLPDDIETTVESSFTLSDWNL